MTRRDMAITALMLIGAMMFAYLFGTWAYLYSSKTSVGQYIERTFYVRVYDDSALFDCRTMGNRKCGPDTRYTFLGFQ